MKFFFDRNWSPYLARAISCLCEPDGHTVVHLDDRFAKNTPDHEWIAALAKEAGWAIITKDRLRKNSLEREALRSTGVLTFIFVKQWAHADPWQQAWGLVRWWPRIVQVAGAVESGAFEVPFRFSGTGKLQGIKL